MVNYPSNDVLSFIADVVRQVKCSSFIDEVNYYKERGFNPVFIYQANKSLYIRLIRVGNDSFVKKSIVLRSFPCSERTQRELIIALGGKIVYEISDEE